MADALDAYLLGIISGRPHSPAIGKRIAELFTAERAHTQGIIDAHFATQEGRLRRRASTVAVRPPADDRLRVSSASVITPAEQRGSGSDRTCTLVAEGSSRTTRRKRIARALSAGAALAVLVGFDGHTASYVRPPCSRTAIAATTIAGGEARSGPLRRASAFLAALLPRRTWTPASPAAVPANESAARRQRLAARAAGTDAAASGEAPSRGAGGE